MSDSDQSSMSKELEAAELRKRKAEAQLAEWQNTRFGRLARYTVLITTLAVVVGGGWTVYVRREETAESRAREKIKLEQEVELRVSDAAEKLTKFDSEGPPPRAQAKFLLDELKIYIGKLPNLGEAGVAERKQRISSDLVAVVKDNHFDCKKSRHLDFDLQALKSWPEYEEMLKQEPSVNLYILDKYVYALTRLHNEDPKFVEGTTQDEERGVKFSGWPKNEETPFLLEKLILGYQLHANLLKSDSQTAAYHEALCQFKRATNNPGLTADVLSSEGLDRCK